MTDVRVLPGDCLEVMADFDEASVDAVVTDPPYAFPGGFMGKSWDTYDGREDAAFGYWLAGLIDGEGHFAIQAHTRGTHAPAFTLKMRADERGTLEAIRRQLGIGSITREGREPNPMVRWAVADKAGCQRLVDLLDKYPLRAKKRMDYAVWRDAVCEWTDRPRGNRWHGPADNSRMASLRSRLMEGRRYVEPAWSGHEYQDWCRAWATEALRVAKPGAHLLAFGGTRTHHRLICGLEDAGWEIRDTLSWLYGSGFPKSLNLDGDWDGWGTALKPAWEPIVLARKPLDGTVAGNVLEHGTGALNIDAGRLDPRGQQQQQGAEARDGTTVFGAERRDGGKVYGADLGRWPANVALDEQAAAMLDEQTGDRRAGSPKTGREPHAAAFSGTLYGAAAAEGVAWEGYGDTGGASRFFYCAKASRSEKPWQQGQVGKERCSTCGGWEYGAPACTCDEPTWERNDEATMHPTVKPLALMRWLVRLVTPPGGLVLDPFAGTGTTGEAALIEGFGALLIERHPPYLDLIERRLSKPIQPTLLGGAP